MESTSKDTNISTIENLPVEILMHIFDYLSPTDLKSARRVCQHWLKILYDPIYCKRLPLVLDYCVLAPSTEPFETLLNAPEERPFLYVVFDKLSCNPSAFYNFIKKIGKNVIDLTLNAYNLDADFLTYFPKLKQLHLQRMSDVDYFNLAPKTLELVTAVYMDKPFDELIHEAMQKRLKSVTGTYIFWEDEDGVPISDELREFLKKNWFFGPLLISNNFVTEPTVEMKNVLKLVITKHIEDYSVLKVFENLNGIKIRYKVIDEEEDSEDEEVDEDDDYDDVCCEFHENLEMPKIKKFWFSFILNYNRSMCDDCFDTILESFPSVEHLTLRFKVSPRQFSAMIKRYPKLKSLEIFCQAIPRTAFYGAGNSNNVQNAKPILEHLKYLECLVIIPRMDYSESLYEDEFVNDDVMRNWPNLPRLKQLDLGFIDRLNNEPQYNFGFITTQCPNVTNFSVRSDFFEATDVIPIAQGWPKLKFLTLILKEEITDDLMRIIGKHCKNLKVFGFYSPRKLSPEEDLFWRFQLYEMIPALRVINVGSTNKYTGRTDPVATYWTVRDIVKFSM